MTDVPQGKRTVTDEQIIEAIGEMRGQFAFTSEVADEFNHTRQWAHNRLTELHESGELQKKKQNQNVIYWPSESSSDC